VTIEFFPDDSENCATGPTPLLRTSISSAQTIPVPSGARGYTVVLTPESDEPLVCYVETQFPE
jgi:hypothetical protein